MSESYRDIITTPNPTATTYEDYVRGIEDLFSRLADAGVYKGDRGENLKAAPINLLIQSGSAPLTYESFTEEGKELLKAIFDDKNPAEVFVTGGDAEMLKKLDFFKSVNTYTWWCTDGDTDKKIFPSTAFVYIDPNATCIRDYSCLLTPKLEPNSSTGKYDLHYSKSEVFPSFWYNPLVFNGKGGWCWKINGVNTDIPASAANDTGEYNNKLFLIRKFTEETTEGTTTETYKYYTSIDDIDKGRGGWYTLENLKDAQKRIPLDGDIGYCLVEVEEPEPEPGNDGQPVLTKINVINLAVYSAGNWIPASIDERSVLVKFDDLFASYIWDCLSHKEVIADDLYIGVSTSNEKNHNISVNDDNRRQLDFTFTGEPYENEADGIKNKELLTEIDNNIKKLEQQYEAALDTDKPIIQNQINTKLKERAEILKKFEENEEGINFTSSYKHVNFGSKSNVDSPTKVNIYSDTYFNKEGTTTFRNNVVFDGNATSDDSESSDTESYKKPSLTINGYDHINISNIASEDAQTDPIHIGANIGVGGSLSIEGDLETEDIISKSVTCSGELRGDRLNVQGITTENGLLNSQKIVVENNDRAITVTPEQLTDKTIQDYLGTSSKNFLNSMGRRYINSYEKNSSSSSNTCTIEKEENPDYIFGTTNVPKNNTLELTYKNCSVAAYLYYRHYTNINFNAKMKWRIEVCLKNSDGTEKGTWTPIYEGSVNSATDYQNVSNQNRRDTYRYLISPMSSGNVPSSLTDNSIKFSNTSYYNVTNNNKDGKITIAPTDNAINIGGFKIRINVYYFYSYVEDKSALWQGVYGIGVDSIGIADFTALSGLVSSSSISIGNNLKLYRIPNSTSNPQAVLFSDGLLVGTSNRHYYIKQDSDGSVVLYATNSSGTEKKTTLFNPNSSS